MSSSSRLIANFLLLNNILEITELSVCIFIIVHVIIYDGIYYSNIL